MDAFLQQLSSNIIQESKRRMIGESVNRVKKCLHFLTEEEIWYRPNEHTNSVGNLVLHLCGNARQWILSGMGGKPDTRKRDLEFSEEGPMPTANLIQMLDELMAEVEDVLNHFDPTQWTVSRKVQGFDETPIGILLHVVEHFSYHTGQIVYYLKSSKNIDLGLYKDIDLNQTSA